MEMNKYAQWMSENKATIQVSGVNRGGLSKKIAYVYAYTHEPHDGEKWVEAEGLDGDEAVIAAIAKANKTPRPLHAEPSVENVALRQQIAELKQQLAIASVGGKPTQNRASAKSDEMEEDAPEPSISVKDAIAKSKK